MFECQHYDTFAKKRTELEKIFGAWPPPFDPVWAVQVSQGRCGSNELWRIVSSFFENTIGEPVYEAMDHPEASEYQNVRENPIPKSGKNYLFYNAFSKDPQRLHFPIFFWHLQNSPKIVHLTREDHLMRAISIYYANLVTDLPDRGKDLGEVYKVYEMSIDFPQLEKYIHISIHEIEVIKRLVSEFVSEDRLLRISHRDLYHTDTLNTIRKCARFLECDLQNKRVSIGLPKDTNPNHIPNKQEIMDRYARDLTEKSHWLPEDIETEAIENEISETVAEHIRLNVDTPESPKKLVNIVVPSQKRQEDRFDLKADQKFYLDEIPKSAKYLHPDTFKQLPNIETELHILDDRWKSMENMGNKVPDHIRELIEVSDIQKNHTKNQYEWVCGFSVFFLKASAVKEHEHRCKPESHDKLIKGVDHLTNYAERCPDTLLRFYVSPEVWERLDQTGILQRPDTEFFKMRFDSEETQFGVIWRMLCLSDKDFEWAIQADCAPDEEWIFVRIADWSRGEFKKWLSPSKQTPTGFSWAGEYLFFDGNWSLGLDSDCMNPSNLAWNLESYDFMSAGGIVTRPAQMPDMKRFIPQYTLQLSSPLKWYHKEADAWTTIPQRCELLPYGWQGFGVDQEMWRFLKKALPVRHHIHQQSIEQIQKYNLPENHVTKRIIAQLISEGSEFVHIHTEDPLFNLI